MNADPNEIPTRIVLPAEVFDRLAAELEEPPRVIPGLVRLVEKHRSTCNPSSCPVCHERATREALGKLDGSTSSAVSVLTDMTRERLDELGGFED